MYAILRATKIKTAGNAGGINSHLERIMNVPNADPELRHLNSRPIGSGDLASDISARLEAAKIIPRKNAVLAIEYLMTFSPEMLGSLRKVEHEGKYTLNGNKTEIDKWQLFRKNSLDWLEKQHGKANIINFTVHMDEKTPHIHAVVVPLDAKGKLNCRAYLGGRERLRAVQDSFAQVHEGIGLKRGMAGSKAEHEEVKKFYSKLPELNTSPSELFKLAEQGKQAVKEKNVLESERDALKHKLKTHTTLLQMIATGKITPEMIKNQLEKEKVEREQQAQKLTKKEEPTEQVKKPNKGMKL